MLGASRERVDAPNSLLLVMPGFNGETHPDLVPEAPLIGHQQREREVIEDVGKQESIIGRADDSTGKQIAV